jgi:hypothetical protein
MKNTEYIKILREKNIIIFIFMFIVILDQSFLKKKL